MSRLPPQPGERIDRSTVVTFTFDGKQVTGHEGDTVASALYAGGRRTFSRSFKYHRPRGLLCCAGQCPNCLVAVDGAPGIRACTEPIRPGMRVEHLNAWPSLDFDVMRITDLAGGPFTPVGFYYRTFIRPRRLWPLYERILRHVAGLGVIAASQAERGWRTEYRRRHADVLVVGGGLAGLHAAIAAAESGADVVLADEGPTPGGRSLLDGDHEQASTLTERARASGVEVLSSAPVLGVFDGLSPVWQASTLHQVRARAHVFATGVIEQPLLFANNDLPGVMLAGAVRRLVAMYGIRPGTTAVVASISDLGLDVVPVLERAGVKVVAVADLRNGERIVAAKGRNRVAGAVLEGPGGRRTVSCDLIVVSGGVAPALSLLLQAGGRAAYDDHAGHVAVDELPHGVYAAGELVGHGMPSAVELSGVIAGRRAAAHARQETADVTVEHARLEMLLDGSRPVAPPEPIASSPGKCFACLCEDVTVKDIKRSVAEGFDSIELAKRYTTVFMGPCQGRMCQNAATRQMAHETGERLQSVGLTTARPPWSTVPMGALAGRPFEPAKRSAIHTRHRELGATVKWAGDWRRAYDYGDPEGEALAVQGSAGLIDVSTLGKLIVRGPDAGTLLDRLYPNVMSNLRPGRIRYGVLLSEAGRITDDGTVARIDEETFYVTTTSGGAAGVEQWFSWWLTAWGSNARLTDVTQGTAAVNLAGPRAREILAALTDIDCSNDAFKYLDAKHAEVAGVPCLLLRIGFVGEVGYEIHCPAAQAVHLWDTILAQGATAGIRPFGLEPQRILRLQKMHILVGQDTDSESTPPQAAMPWIVKLDKPQDFIGRWALEQRTERSGEGRLVGFVTEERTVPTEGSVVVEGATPAGQVTSARWSPKLQRVIGMAWVSSEMAREDTPIVISDAGRRIAATVRTRPFYDPDGEVLRS